jgi:NADH dehydrogenase FAD-containing subunit
MHGKRLVLLGAGHAHLELLSRVPRLVDAGVHVSVVGPNPYHYYSGMSPGLLSERYADQDVRFPVECMTTEAGGVFHRDAVVTVRATRRELELASGATLPYDVASFNIGSEIPSLQGTDAGPAVFKVKPIQNVSALHDTLCTLLQEITREVRLVIVGGGPAGLEMAGNLVAFAQRHGAARILRIMILAGSKFLKGLPERARRLARKSLESRGVEIIEGQHASSITKDGVLTDASQHFPAEVVVLALGTKPPSVFRDSDLPLGEDGGLLVDEHLRCPDHPELFGGGDCICPSGRAIPRVGVQAVVQGPILADNIEATLAGGGSLRSFTPQERFMLIYNLGDGTAIFHKWGIALRSRLFMRMKDMIDRGFMRSATPDWTATSCEG